MSTNERENQSFPPIFKSLQERTGHHKCGALPTIKPYLLAIRFHGIRSLTRKENSFQGSCRRLRVQLRYCKFGPKGSEYPHSGSGMLTKFFFDKWPIIEHFETEFPCLLGSTNPCSTAVHMELFPLQSSKFSFEYLLPPPKPALEAVSPRLTSKSSSRTPCPPACQSFTIYSDSWL